MRIAYVVNQFPPNITSGLGRYVEEIGPHLVASGEHELTVFTLNDGHQPVHERQGAITLYRPVGRLLGALRRRRRLNRTRRIEFLLLAGNVLVSNWRYVRRLRRERQHRPDLVVVHDSTNFLSGLLCHYRLRLPVVFHVHTTEYGVARQRSITDPFRLFAAIERWLGRVARRVVVPTKEVRDQLVAHGWPPDRIDVVPLGGSFERALAGGLDRARLHADTAARRDRLGIPAGHRVLLFVGRLERQKGIYPLLAAMRQLATKLPDLHLLLVGEGDEAGVARIVAGTGLAGRVTTSGGFVTGRALWECYALAEACVFPSLFEPFGLVATEAMALGKPVILGSGFSRLFLGDPDHPAVRFVRSTDPDDIARTVAEVMSSPGLRRDLGERGQRFVAEQLSWSGTATATLAAYRAAAGGR